jgi:hypothetical protein
LFFSLFIKINFGHNYTREEILDIISVSDFKDYSIARKDEEIRIKLKKQIFPNKYQSNIVPPKEV